MLRYKGEEEMEKRNVFVVGCIMIMAVLMMSYYMRDRGQAQVGISDEVYVVAERTNEEHEDEKVLHNSGQLENVADTFVMNETFEEESEVTESENVEQDQNISSENDSEIDDSKNNETVHNRIGSVVTKAVNIRKTPVLDAKVLSIIERGTQFTVLDETEDGWYQIELDGKTGYVYSEYITLLDN